MKKVAFCAAAAAMCGSLLAVESANVVGYNSSDLTTGAGKLSMVGGSFASVGGDGFQMNGNMTIANIKGGVNGAGDSDTLLMWDPTLGGGAGGYKTFYYYDDGSEAGWCDPATDDYVEKSYTTGFPAGSAFWFNAIDGATKTITFSGAIEDAEYIEPALADGKQLSMVANAYPVPLKLNNSTVVTYPAIVGGVNGAGDSDTLLMWDPTLGGGAGGYKTFYYYDDGGEAGWCDPATDDYFEKSYPDGLPVGTALWFNPISATARTIRFIKPF